jgi:RNA ligase
MKIKLVYPKIPDSLDCPLKQCVAFEKLDGTNIHWVWSVQEEKFTEFGTRRDRFHYSDAGFAMFHQAHPGLDGLEDAFFHMSRGNHDGLSMDEWLFWTHPYPAAKQIILFTEFHGSKSFAGAHDPKDNTKRCTLIDVQVDGVMVPPDEFIKKFRGLYQPKIIFQGKFTGQLFMDVRNGKYDVKEGVVVKGVVGKQIYMAKIKTQAYLDKLKETFKDDWKEYGE